MGYLNLREIVEEVADAIRGCQEGLREMAFEIFLKYSGHAGSSLNRSST